MRHDLAVLAPQLERALGWAVDEARLRQHAALTPEHLLWAITHDDEGAAILRACGTDAAELRRDLELHLAQLARRPNCELAQAIEFQRALQRGAMHAQSAGKDQLTIGLVLVALLHETTTVAVEMLASRGVTRLAVRSFISHGQTAVPLVELPRATWLGRWRRTRSSTDRYEVVFHNDDFTTKEFVVDQLTTVFELSRETAEQLMETAHASGVCAVGSYSLHEATYLMNRVIGFAHHAEFPLRLSVAPI